MKAVPVFADVQAAARRIAPHAVRTPLVESSILSALGGGRVFLKLETLQRTGSFKFRGAFNRMAGDRGQASTEYAGVLFVIVAIIGALIALGFSDIGQAIKTKISDAVSKVGG